MIQKKFFKGARMKWRFPGEGSFVNDGAIVANPPTPQQSMTYDGMDDELISLTHVNATGLTLNEKINFAFLRYVPGRTSKISLNSDVITGYMSGCLITLWIENGGRYVGHVGTIDNNSMVNSRVKSSFLAVMPANTTGFSPFDAWPTRDLTALRSVFRRKQVIPKVLALVTGSGRFFSILVFVVHGSDEFVVGGVREGKVLSYAELRQRLC